MNEKNPTPVGQIIWSRQLDSRVRLLQAMSDCVKLDLPDSFWQVWQYELAVEQKRHPDLSYDTFLRGLAADDEKYDKFVTLFAKLNNEHLWEGA